MANGKKSNNTILNVKIQGLNTFQSDLSAVPEGSLLKADNVVFDKEGIIETRRGFKQRINLDETLKDSTVSSFHTFDKLLLMHMTTGSEGALYYTEPTWSRPLLLEPNLIGPDNETIRSDTALANLYFTSSTGIKKMESLSRGVIDAGVPKAFALDYGISGVLDADAVTRTAIHYNVDQISNEASRDEDPFEAVIPADTRLNVELSNTVARITLPPDFELPGNYLATEISVPARSGLDKPDQTESRVYPILGFDGQIITVDIGITGEPEERDRIPAGDLVLVPTLEDPFGKIDILVNDSPSTDLIGSYIQVDRNSGFGNTEELSFKILNVNTNERRITIENTLNLQPTAITLPKGTEVGLFTPQQSEEGVRVLLFFKDINLSDVKIGNTITFPESFLDSDTPITVKIAGIHDTYPAIIIEDNVFFKAVKDAETELRKVPPGHYKVEGTTSEPLSVSAFSTPTDLYLLLPNNNDFSSTDAGSFQTLDDVLATGFVGLSIGDDNAGNLMTPSYYTNADITASSSHTLFSGDNIINVANRFAQTHPGIGPSDFPQEAPEASADYRWVRFPRNFNRGPQNLFEEFGALAIDRHASLSGSTLYPSTFNRISGEGWSYFIQPGQIPSTGVVQRGDVISIPPNFFQQKALLSGSSYLPPEDSESIPAHLGVIQSVSTDLAPWTEYRYKVNPTFSDENSQLVRYTKKRISLSERQNIDPILILRPNFTVSIKSNFTLTSTSIGLYESPGIIRFNIDGSTVTTTKVLKVIDKYDRRTLRKDLYFYSTAKEVINSREYTVLEDQVVFTLDPNRISGAEIRNNNNVRVRVNPALDEGEAFYMSAGTDNEGILKIPTGTTFLGIEGPANITMRGAATSSFTVNMTDDQLTTVTAELAKTNPVLLNNALDFTQEVTFLFGISDIVDAGANELTLTLTRVSAEQQVEFNSVLDISTSLFIPQNSSLLGIQGPLRLRITGRTEQTDSDAATINIDSAEFSSVDLDEIEAPYEEGAFIIGNFRTGVIVTAVGEEVATALRPNSQYAYYIVWSYIDDNNNTILGEPSSNLIVTRPEGSRAVNLGLIVTVPDDILNADRVDRYTFEIFRSSNSNGANIPPVGDASLIYTGILERNEDNFLLKRFVVEDIVPDASRGKPLYTCLLYTSPSPRDRQKSRMPSSA